MRCWRRMEKKKWSETITNEQVLERIGEKILLNNILHRKANCVGHILRRNCLHDAIEGQMKEVGRRKIKFLNDLRNNKILGAKGGAED